MRQFFLNFFLYIIVTWESTLMVQFNDFYLMINYRKYIKSPNPLTFCSFSNYVKEFYILSPIECLKLVERYQYDWKFVLIFLKILNVSWVFIDPLSIPPRNQLKSIKWLLKYTIWTFKRLSLYDKRLSDAEIEKIYFLASFIEKMLWEWRAHNNVDQNSIDNLIEKISICKFLANNMSIDFAKETIDYDSLFRVFNEIMGLEKSSGRSSGDFSRKVKLYSLLSFYLFNIWKIDCMEIFEMNHESKNLIIYLILRLSKESSFSYCYMNGNFFPENLKIYFKELYEGGSLCLDPIEKILKLEDVNFLISFNIRRKFSRFRELSNFLDRNHFAIPASTEWKVKALSSLETYFSRHGPNRRL
jgi:hypothetical protein